MFDSEDLKKQAELARRLADQAYSERGREEFVKLAQEIEEEAGRLERKPKPIRPSLDRRRAND